MKPALLLLIFAFAVSAPAADEPKLNGAKVESRALRGTLQAEVAAAAGSAEPRWIAWAAAAMPGESQSCCYDSNCGWGCRLDRTVNGSWCPAPTSQAPASPVARLDGPRTVFVFLRVEGGEVRRVRTFTPDCTIDAGEAGVVWLSSGVTESDSVAFLKGLRSSDAVQALGMHSGADADRALEELLSRDREDKVRRQAAFWLGSTRGQRGADVLAKLIREDPDTGLKQHIAFALSQSREGIPVLIQLVRNSGTEPKVREKAMFWLARSKEPEAKRFVDSILSR